MRKPAKDTKTPPKRGVIYSVEAQPKRSNVTIDLTPEDFPACLFDMDSQMPNWEEAFISKVESYFPSSADKNKPLKAIVKHIVSFSYGSYIQPFVALIAKYGMLEKTVSLLERLLEAGSSELFQTLVNLIPTLGNE